MSEIITSLPQSFLNEFWDDVIGRVPEEKVKAELRQVENQRIMQAVGSAKIEGIGQKIAEIDSRLFFRMQHAFGHHEGWLHDLLADNPQLCAPGYKPKTRGILKSKTMVGGKPI